MQTASRLLSLPSLRLRAVCLLVVGMLVACTTAPSIKRYTLDVVPQTATATDVLAPDANERQTLVLAKVTLPGYLNSKSVVHRKGSKILMDDYQLWAEPLYDATPRVLAINLANALPDIHVVQQPASLPEKPDWKLFVRVQRFEAVDDRAVELDARWSIVDKKGKTVFNKYLSLEEPIADGKFAGDDLSDVVIAHGKLLAALASAIREDFQSIARP